MLPLLFLLVAVLVPCLIAWWRGKMPGLEVFVAPLVVAGFAISVTTWMTHQRDEGQQADQRVRVNALIDTAIVDSKQTLESLQSLKGWQGRHRRAAAGELHRL